VSALANAVPPELPVLGGVFSVQFGSAFADTVFDRAGPAGVAFLRVLFTAIVLLVVVRPRLRSHTREELRLVAVYGLVLAGMNWSFYEALHRLPLGVAVTIEFTGPLAVAIAGSRKPLDGLWVLLAGGGVVILASRGGNSGVQPLGVVLVLIAAACWAGYILLAKRVGRSFAAGEALALGMSIGTVLVLPAGVIEGGSSLLHPGVFGACFGIAMLSSLIPYTLEMVALRRLATHVFGLLMSIEPAVAALAGVVVLGQSLSGTLIIALAMVVAASVGSSLVARRAPIDVPDA
jgi:inner membrane transporter RhtA